MFCLVEIHDSLKSWFHLRKKKKASIYIPLMEVNCRRQQESTLKGHFEINIYFMLMYAFILNHLVDNLSKAIYSILKVQFTFNQFEWFQRNYLAVASFMLKSQATGNMYSIPQLHVYGVCFDKPQHLYRLKQNNEGFHKTRNLTRGGGLHLYQYKKRGKKAFCILQRSEEVWKQAGIEPLSPWSQ